ncbi:alpha/beta hydrolase [Pedobacter miscanthi]|uniref:Alpha/beta hydrolase n=2 Tax=Pedobacter miscanthi TaxID=2259170 RepID=A0A366KZ90_9SPHI|nr:alpha/beta hydrolase [Pedobacter miscanthi]
MHVRTNVLSRTRLVIVSLLLIIAAVTTAGAQGKEWYADEHIAPEVKNFLLALNNGGPGLETLSPKNARAVLVNAQKSVKVDYSGISESEKIIKVDGHTVTLNIVRPQGKNGVLPVFIFIHGGGWVLGDYPTHKRMVRDLVVGSGAVGVFVNYTRTPEAKFPVAIEEIYSATKWVSEHGSEIGVDGKRLALIGNSVGGNMTAVTSILAKERKGPEIKTAVMMWPIVDANFETQSYKDYGRDRFLTTPLMKWMYDMYIPDASKRGDYRASPLKASLEQLKSMPPTLIQVAENDVLRDEGEAFGRRLLEAGVEATTVRYNGVIHDWGLLNGLAEIQQTKDAFAQASSQLKRYLF